MMVARLELEYIWTILFKSDIGVVQWMTFWWKFIDLICFYYYNLKIQFRQINKASNKQ